MYEVGQEITITKSAATEVATVTRVTPTGQVIAKRNNGTGVRFNKDGKQIGTSSKWFVWRIER